MWIDPPYVDVRALLGIDAPLGESFGHAGRGLKRGHVDKSLREKSEPGAFEIDPFWKGVWARLAFKPLLANPFGKESTDFAQWTAGWKQEESATWDITQTKEVVLSSVVKRTIHWGSRTSFSAGLAALLQGKSRASNPHAPGGLDHELWDDGWLRGFWLKGLRRCASGGAAKLQRASGAAPATWLRWRTSSRRVGGAGLVAIGMGGVQSPTGI